MKKFPSLTWLVFIPWLTGCAFLQSFTPSTPEQVQILIDREQYTRALQAIDSATQSSKYYSSLQKKRNKLQRLISKLEQSTIHQAHLLTSKQEWHKAEQLYQETLKKIPHSVAIQKAHRSFLDARQHYLNDLESELSLYQGQWAKQTETTLNEIQRVIPNDTWFKIRQWRFKQKKSDALENLVTCTQTAITTENYPLAKRCLSIIKEIDHEQEFADILSRANQKLTQNEKQIRKQRVKNSQALIAQLKQEMSLEKLIQGNQQILQFETAHRLNQEEMQTKQALQALIDQGVTEKIEQGKISYSQGQIAKALAIWEELYEITPNNKELEALIHRAQRVLDKLKNLNQEGPIIQPPSPEPLTPANELPALPSASP